jgi:hypothetical protein
LNIGNYQYFQLQTYTLKLDGLASLNIRFIMFEDPILYGTLMEMKSSDHGVFMCMDVLMATPD